MAQINRSSIPSLLRPGLKDVFGDYNTYPALWKDIYKMYTSDKAAEYEIEMQTLGIAQLKEEGAPVAMSSFQQAYQSKYLHQFYGIGYIITAAAQEDNLYTSQTPQQNAMLRDSLDTLKNINAAYLFNNAFNADSTLSDGVPMCSTLHPIATGYLSNTFTNGVGFNEAGVEDLINLIRSCKNVAGLQIDLKSVKALVPQKLAFQAARIFKSEYQTDTANNNISAIVHDKYMPGGYLVNQFLTNPNNWFILTDEQNGLKYFKRSNLKIDYITDVNTDNITVRAVERYSFGNSNWRSVYGVKGS